MKLPIIKENQEGYGLLIEHDAGYILSDKKQLSEISSIGIDNVSFDPTKPLTCILQKYDIENKNGRVYPENILKREADKYKILIEKGESSGELNHPQITELDGDRISHRITEIWWEGKTLVGKIQLILSEAFINAGQVFTKGDLVATYIKNGLRVGISSRGVGSLKKKSGKNEVQEDFEIICWDIVLQPSTPNAWVYPNAEERHQFVESKISNELDKFLIG